MHSLQQRCVRAWCGHCRRAIVCPRSWVANCIPPPCPAPIAHPKLPSQPKENGEEADPEEVQEGREEGRWPPQEGQALVPLVQWRAQKPRVRECSDQSICKCTGACVFVLWLGAAPSWAPLYISKVVKGLKGKFGMSKKAMAIVNSFAADLFDRGQTPRLRLGCVLRLLCWRFCTALFGSTRCVSPPQDRRRGRPPGQAHRRQDAVLRGHAGGLPPPGELRAPAAAPLFARQCSHRATP